MSREERIKALRTELLMGCADCGRRFIDSESVQDGWKNVRYIVEPVIVTVEGQRSKFVCPECASR
jgi:hypothetical protein